MEINNTQELKLAIAQLESKSKAHVQNMKSAFGHTVDGLKPANLIRNTFGNVVMPGLKHNIFNIAAGAGTGFILKKIFGSKKKKQTQKKSGGGIGRILLHGLRFGINLLLK